MSLILTKGYDAVTVRDIIDEADIGRSTFYAHYCGKEDLLRSGFRTLRDELEAARRDAHAEPDRSRAPLQFSLAMFVHARGYDAIYRALVGGRGGVVATAEIRQILAELVREEMPALGKQGAVSRELAVEFVVGAFLAVLGWWLERRPGLAPEEVDALFRRLVLDGIGRRASEINLVSGGLT